jgi:hypothetical protein
LFKVTWNRIKSGAQIDCSHLGQPSEVFGKSLAENNFQCHAKYVLNFKKAMKVLLTTNQNVLFYLFSSTNFNDFVLETIKDKTSNSQDEHGIQPTDTSSTSPTQPSDSDKTSSMDASYCSPELTSFALQAQMPFSPDCKPPQSGHIQQEKCSTELVHETTKNRRNSTLKPKHPHRDRGNITDDDLNSPHQRPLLPKNSTLSQK